MSKFGVGRGGSRVTDNFSVNSRSLYTGGSAYGVNARGGGSSIIRPTTPLYNGPGTLMMHGSFGPRYRAPMQNHNPGNRRYATEAEIDGIMAGRLAVDANGDIDIARRNQVYTGRDLRRVGFDGGYIPHERVMVNRLQSAARNFLRNKAIKKYGSWKQRKMTVIRAKAAARTIKKAWKNVRTNFMKRNMAKLVGRKTYPNLGRMPMVFDTRLKKWVGRTSSAYLSNRRK